MNDQRPAAPVARFGVFEFDVDSGELWNGGHRLRLQEQPRQVLRMLLARPGEVVTRDALRAALWPDDTFVDFDAGLNVAVNKLRHALRDSAASPRFIETLPRRGYRFIAPVAPTSASTPDVVPSLEPRSARRGAGAMVLAGSLVLAVAATSAAVYLMRTPRSPVPLRSVPVTTLSGMEFSPAVSPDGTHVAFLRASGDRWDPQAQVYVQPFGSAHPTKLALADGAVLKTAWSPDGRYLALLRHPDAANMALHDIAIVPAAGGAERRIASALSGGHGLSWSPDGASIAIVDKTSEKEPDALYLLSPDTGRKERLTSPPGSAIGDCAPAFSPDGRTLAFLREKSRFQADLYVLSLIQRTLTRVVSDEGLCTGGVAWTPDGASLVFASQLQMAGGIPRLKKIAATGGAAQDLGVDGFEPTTSRENGRLVFTRFLTDWNVWRVSGPMGQDQAMAPRRLIDSTQLDFFPRYSPDGARIAYVSQRSGATEVWTSDAEGANPLRLTFLDRDDLTKSVAWSPDGRELVFTSLVDGARDLYVIASQGGLPERITATPGDERLPRFSRDGRWLYFTRQTSGEEQIWKAPRSGGPAVQVTKHGGADAYESPDGRFLLFTKGSFLAGRFGIWRMSLPDGDEEKLVEAGDVNRWDVYERGVCYLRAAANGAAAVECFDVEARSVRSLATLEKQPLPTGFSVSPDGRWILFTRVDRNESDLMMVEHFR